MKYTTVVIATDAWHPQINGIVNTLEYLKKYSKHFKYILRFITPRDFSRFKSFINPNIEFAYPEMYHLRHLLKPMHFDYIHIATEGIIGVMTRMYCVHRAIPFTTSYHTRIPEYFAIYTSLGTHLAYKYMRWFHNRSIGTMVHSDSLRSELSRLGFFNLYPWCRGVDTSIFHPRSTRIFGTAGPVFLYAGRITLEKNLDAFLRLNLPGKKVVVGDGPRLMELTKRYPEVLFTGWKNKTDLALAYASADAFVFPSKTDVLSNAVLEALASGTPVAAFPVPAVQDIVRSASAGVVNKDLRLAALTALGIDRRACHSFARSFSWRKCTKAFIRNIEQAHAEFRRRTTRNYNDVSASCKAS